MPGSSLGPLPDSKPSRAEKFPVLFVHPPVSKPCEPPPGIARLQGALLARGIRSAALDLNLEGILDLAGSPGDAADTWTRRASRNLSRHLEALRSGLAFRHFSRYQRSALDLNRLLQRAGDPGGVDLGLANYQRRTLSPVKSGDLLRAAETPRDDPFFPYFEKRLSRALEEMNPGLVGFSLNYLAQAFPAFAMMGYLRRTFPGVALSLGGSLVTSWARRSGWENPFRGLVDSLVAGPGEGPLLGLLGVDPCGAPAGSLPDYGSFPERDYLSPGFILPYSASGGCYWNRCLFCPERAEGTPYLPAPPDRVIQELSALVARHGPVLVHFLDNALSPGLLQRLAARPPGAPWYGFARITDHLAEPDFCRALRQSGCVMLQIGLESGDPAVLDRLHKGMDLETASRALGSLKKAGIAAYVYLLFGTPAEDEAGARKTLDFTARHAGEIGFLNLALFNLPARGEEARNLATREFYQGDLSLYSDFSHPSGWDRGRVRAFLEKEFKRHPAIAPILRRDPPLFTSNHAPFFTEGMRKSLV